ncbi:MAG TPA: cellulase family glycosylhydrolase, partial [Pirellulales bacterium]
TFSGSYHETPSSFGIVDNTLAPAADRVIGPWPRSTTSGAGDGSNKYGLDAWNEEYFKRLKDFVGEAGRRGIVVELVLFCTIYDDKLWAIHPFNPRNNVGQIGPSSRTDVYTLKDKRLQSVQEKMAARIVRELRAFDNVYFEICNEPYFGGITPEWNNRMADVIAAAEPPDRRHLVAQNIANGSAVVKNPSEHVSILNFHYAAPPDAVAANAKLGRAIADDETGFKGKGDLVYRAEGWNFLLAGGAIYDNLDYSFTPHHPDGSAEATTSPGGGGVTLRKQLAILKKFIEEVDFIHMSHDNSVIAGGVPEKATARALVNRGKAYADYLQGGKQANLVLELPAGRYRVEWANTKTGEIDKSVRLEHPGGKATLASPEYSEDTGLRVNAVKD